jgi:tetratricopeptide (TPR) repeat protein
MHLRFALSTVVAAVAASSAFALPLPRKEARVPEVTPVYAPAMAFVALDERMPRSKLKASVYDPNLCLYRYRVSTRSEECQKFVDQALGYFYSYVWMETARSAETALKYDPDCAYAWLMLHKGLEKWGQGDNMAALKKAQELMPKASHREQLLITAKLHEKNLLGSGGDAKKRAAQTLDELLSIYDDDEEAWFARGAITGGFQGGPVECVPYYKSCLKINPLHPGANHELVHYYDNTKRPALGWPYAEGYVASSPGIPHAFHMQAHLAMRIGKWDKTTDRSAKAIELERNYHKVQGVLPNQDHQYYHHLEVLTTALLHDGRYREALETRKVAEHDGYRMPTLWFKVALGQRNWKEAESFVAEQRKGDKGMAAYLAALLELERGDLAKAGAEVDVLRQIQQAKRTDKKLEQRLWEVQGLLQCANGSADGLKLLQRAVDGTKNDYFYHSWGGGGYYMEAWGVGALDAGDAAVAEEAFQEALAHDSGSAKAAAGLEALCARLGRTEEAHKFEALTRRLWSKADPADLEAMRTTLANKARHIPVSTAASTGAAR